MKNNTYPKGFVPRNEEFEKAQTIKQEVYNFLKEAMEEASEKAFKALGIECTEKHAGEYGDGSVYGMGLGEGGKCNIKVGSKTSSYLEKQISYGGKRMFVETSFEIDGRNEMIHMIYRTTEKAVSQGHREFDGGFFVNEDMHMSLSDMTKFKKDMKKILEDAAEKEAAYLTKSKIGVDDRIETDVTQSVVESIVGGDDDSFLSNMDKLFESDGIDEEEQAKEDALIKAKLEEEEGELDENKPRPRPIANDDPEMIKAREIAARKKNKPRPAPKSNPVDEMTTAGGGAGSAGNFGYDVPFGGGTQKRKMSSSAPFDQPINEGDDFDPRFKETAYYQRMMNDELKGQGNIRLVQEKNEKGDSFWTVVGDDVLKRYEKNHVMGAPGAEGVEPNSKEEEDLAKGHGSKHTGGKKKKINEAVEQKKRTLEEQYQSEYMQIDESVRKRYKPQRAKTQEEISDRWKTLTNFGERQTIKEAENKADDCRSPFEGKEEKKPLNESQLKSLTRNQNLSDGSIVDGKKIVAVKNHRNREYLMFEEDANNREKAFCFDFVTGMRVSNPNFGLED